MWFKTDAPEEVRFAIVAKDVDQTEIGFSITKDIVRVLYLENNSVFFLIPWGTKSCLVIEIMYNQIFSGWCGYYFRTSLWRPETHEVHKGRR